MAGKTLQGKKPREERAVAVKQASGSIGQRRVSRCCRGNTLEGS
jgi:hypothetical protein